MALGALILVALGISAVIVRDDGGEEDDSGEAAPELTEPACIEVEIPSTLRSNSEFEVSFEFIADSHLDCPQDVEPIQIMPPKVLVLWRGGEKLNNLISGSVPHVGPPIDDPIVTGEIRRGPGPYTFALPELESGSYVLCSVVGTSQSADPSSPEGIDGPSDQFCRSITVAS